MLFGDNLGSNATHLCSSVVLAVGSTDFRVAHIRPLLANVGSAVAVASAEANVVQIEEFS